MPELRFLADEDFPGDAVSALRAASRDVAWMRTDAPGSPDASVLERASKEGRVLLTCDKDFGELAFRVGLPATCGILLFRLSGLSPGRTAAVACAAVLSRDDWASHFSVVEPGRIRMRCLPGRPS